MTELPESQPAVSAIGIVENSSQVIDGVDVDRFAAAVIACPSVSGLLTDPFSAVTTLLPGRRVTGVRVLGNEVQVAVRSRWGSTAAMLRREILVATVTMLAGHRLHIIIGDIDDPTSSPDEQPASTASSTPGHAAPGTSFSLPPSPPQGAS